jgi:hypothetical protein
MLRRFVLMTAVIALTVAGGLEMRPGNAWATAGKKVNCDAVMSEVKAGKKTKDIATDLKISTSSVYRCKKKAGATGPATASQTKPGTTAMPAAATSPK